MRQEPAREAIRRIHPRRFQRLMVVGVTAGILVVGTAIAVTGLLPYYRYMEQSTGERLRELMEHRALRVEQFHRRILTVAEQISSRTQLRLSLEAYNRGERSLVELVAASQGKLADALLPSSDAVGVSRYDPSGRRLIAVGQAPNDPGERLPVTPGAANLYRVLVRDGSLQLIVIGPIRRRDGGIAGYDAVRFRADALAAYIGTPGSERFNERYSLYTGADSTLHRVWPPPERAAAPTAAVRETAAELESGEPTTELLGESTVMVRPVDGTPFVLALSVPTDAIHGPARRRIVSIIGIIAFLAVAGSALTILLTQPLARRMAFYARTLEEQLSARTEALAESEERYRTIFEESPLGVALYDADGVPQEANSALLELFGFETMPDPHTYRLFDAAGLAPEAAARLRRGESVRDVFEVDFAARSRRYPTSRRRSAGFFERLVTPLGNRGNGSPKGFVVQVLDVTEATLARRRMAKSLNEKQVLLREVHHRVKNNLQIVSSLLNLQLANTSDETARKTLEESRMRVTSMALIHEQLYQSKDLAQIPFADYLKSLVYAIAQTHEADARSVDVRVHCHPVALSMEEAIPCGLIVNELVANAFEHAFSGRARGSVDVRFSVEADRYAGVIEDDGVGLTDDFSLHGLRSLGVKLVQSLVAQLDGELAVSDEGGVRWTFTFPRDSQAAVVAD